jgi:hypothetical protein
LATAFVTIPGVLLGEQPQAAASSPAVAAQSPELSLAAAATASGNLTYRLKITHELETGGVMTRPRTDDMEGAFDPATDTGYLLYDNGNFEYRLIAGTLYGRGFGDRPEIFTQFDGGHAGLHVTRSLGVSGLTSAEPQTLVAFLTDADAIVTQTSPTSYRYSITNPSSHSANVVLEGDITLDANGRIAKFTCDTIANSAPQDENVSRTIVELSGYGLPVHVEPPAPGEIQGVAALHHS